MRNMVCREDEWFESDANLKKGKLFESVQMRYVMFPWSLEMLPAGQVIDDSTSREC